ncbi:MAG: transcription antitermination factor NusB [Acidimicrobiaceae bacterium]|nr:transcription antitermination factor NusB [Acidimicrobiaceae bacterium]MDE0516447.1 transcription antitermination factor NusB [Acidimicrobiaceae bacterium]MDE0654957.1 transcription antitermination factor NusB [Acidimicrobiaceae bacterium]MXZ95609.1 transcription antitermination factor NusB [Acidimicrobiaceae bacterium]MYF42534.1 transcription antitermination factor NusB [Acidimicrobiaceae bacterium]
MPGSGTSVPGFGTRREAREDALAVLYEAEIAGGSAFEALARRAVPPSEYAMELALGVDADRESVDDLLRRHLVGWRLERLAVVDRTLARIAAWELIRRDDVPTGVVLSEAVALATQYCSAESPRFLNGVLRAVADEVRGSDSPA